jgi:hypothetical protein
MKMKLSLSVLSLAALTALASTQLEPAISGDYLEVRSCDVYTGACFANAEMNLSGKEGIMVWSVREGSWNGTALGGLSVIAVVCTDGTLGDLSYQPRAGKAVLILDEKADAQQREALSNLARSMAGKLIKEVVAVRTVPIQARLGTCTQAGCASVKAGNLVEVNTRCLGDHDHLCGNEETYYPPLTSVEHAIPAFTERASFKGSGLNLTWEATGQRSAFVASFSR